MLLDAARELSIEVRFDHRCIRAEPRERVALAFDDGRAETVDLVLACDGIRSAVRGSMRFQSRNRPVNEA